MKLRMMISSLALVSAISLSGGAFAQMIGGVQVPADQMGNLQEKCAALNAAANASLAEPLDESDDATATGSVVANGDEDPEGGNSDPASSKNFTALMASLSIEQCKEAGF